MPIYFTKYVVVFFPLSKVIYIYRHTLIYINTSPIGTIP